jgi:antitoxin ParD1/3/4
VSEGQPVNKKTSGLGNNLGRARLRLLEEQEAQLSALRAALIEGEKSGIAIGFDFDEFLTRKAAPRK